MNGDYTASGIDYQREVFLFLILKYLYEKSLIDAEMEVFIKTYEGISNVDFSITVKEKERTTKFYYEAKEGRDIARKNILKKVVKKLHKFHFMDSLNRYIIIHSIIPQKELKEFSNKPFKWTKENVCRKNKLCNSNICEFPSLVSPLFLPRNIVGEILEGDWISDIELRSMHIVKTIVNNFGGSSNKNTLWRRAESIYKALNDCIKTLTRRTVEVMRNPSVKKPQRVKISLNRLIYFENSFTDDFKTTDNFNDEQKYPRQIGEEPKDIAFRKFCDLFNLKLSIPKY